MPFKNTKIIVNARFVTQDMTGVQRFSSEISKRLKKRFSNIEFVSPKNIIQHKLAKALQVKTNLPLSYLKGHLWEQIALTSYLFKQKENYILLSLGNTGPLFIKKQIYTLHDIGFKIHPKWYSSSFSVLYKLTVPILLKTSRHVLTVSQTSKNHIYETYNIPLEKISVVYNAVNLPKIYQENTIKGIDEDFILCVSSFNPRKNLNKLVEAFLNLDEQSIHLYLVGNFNMNYADHQLINHNRVHLLTDIDDKALVTLYKNAKLFVYPSLYEGFGIPILEAMQFNLQICASDIPCFREIFENSLLYFNPKSTTDITKSIKKGLKTPVNRMHQEQVLKKYNWNNSAERIQKIIFDVYEGLKE